MTNPTLKVCELFKSVQGETTFAGKPCAFVRLSGCDAGCTYCDTRYAAEEPGTQMSIDAIRGEILAMGSDLVMITGGEPLKQKETATLAYSFTGDNKTVLVETNGLHDISVLPYPVIRIMDMKCPSSGVTEQIDWYNLAHLRHQDEIKFVIADRTDYEWAREVMEKYNFPNDLTVLMGVVAQKLEPHELCEWMLFDNLDARLQLQLHKYIWPEQARGV